MTLLHLWKISANKCTIKKHCCNTLDEKNISDGECSHALIVWNTFKLKHLREYYDLDVTLNVLLLIDIFENLRKVSFDFYEPDCLTISGLSRNRMLKITSDVFELFPDIDKHLFIEKTMRGGIYICS